MKNYKNVIKPSLLKESDKNTLDLDVVPPPELYLLMKIVTVCAQVLWNQAAVANWFKGSGILFHGYNDGGLDGRNSNNVDISSTGESFFFCKWRVSWLPSTGWSFGEGEQNDTLFLKRTQN